MREIVPGQIYYKTTFSSARTVDEKLREQRKSFLDKGDTKSLFRKEVEEGKSIYSFVGTKEIEDRDGDIVEINGMNVKNYEVNPVVLWGHDHVSTPIGKVVALTHDKKKKELIFDIVFASTEKGQEVETLVKEGMLNATSIGFQVFDLKYKEDTGIFHLTDTELLEISIVNVPANPAATLADKESEEDATETKALTVEDIRAIVQEMVAEQLVKPEEEEEDEEEKEDEQEQEPDKENPSETTDADPKEGEEEEADDKIDYDELATRIANILSERQAEDSETDTQPDEDSSEEENEDEDHSAEQVPEETPEPEEIRLVRVENLEEDDEFIVVANHEEETD